jgi:hypothetical protein
MDTGGPYINAALLCEKVLQERDGVLSFIRVVDRFTLMTVSAGATLPEPLPAPTVTFNIAIVLKSGLYKGTAPIKFVVHSPAQQKIGESTIDVFFEGDDRGVNLVSPQQMQIAEDGIYWIDVFCADALLTRVPFRVIIQRVMQGSVQAGPEAS